MNNRYKECIECHQAFSNQNVYSMAGWRETQISGLCELCFDNITNIEEPEDEDKEVDYK